MSDYQNPIRVECPHCGQIAYYDGEVPSPLSCITCGKSIPAEPAQED